MSDDSKSPVLTPDFRLRCVELAERTVYFGQRREAGASSYASTYEDKSLREIFDRADRIAQYCVNTEVPASLIERLRTALCAKD